LRLVAALSININYIYLIKATDLIYKYFRTSRIVFQTSGSCHEHENILFLSLWALVFANNNAFPYEMALEYYALTLLPAANHDRMNPGFALEYGN
jgi:hypothetical protein